MTTENEARLRRLLDAGKITQEEYDQLRENLPEEPAATPGAPPPPPPPPMTYRTEAGYTFWNRPRPWQVWFCAVFLALASLLPLLGANSRQLPVLLVSAVLNTALGFGLLARWRWVFIAAYVITAPSCMVLLFKGGGGALLLNLVFMVVLWGARSHFFPSREDVVIT